MDKHEEILRKFEEQKEAFRLHAIQDSIDFAQRPTKEEMKQIVHDALIDFFTSKGLMSKNIIVTVAVVVGSLVVIGGGLKWLLGLVGFYYLGK